MISGGISAADRRQTGKHKIIIALLQTFLQVLLQLFLKYAYTLDVSIHHFDHIAFFDGTLLIFQNF